MVCPKCGRHPLDCHCDKITPARTNEVKTTTLKNLTADLTGVLDNLLKPRFYGVIEHDAGTEDERHES